MRPEDNQVVHAHWPSRCDCLILCEGAIFPLLYYTFLSTVTFSVLNDTVIYQMTTIFTHFLCVVLSVCCLSMLSCWILALANSSTQTQPDVLLYDEVVSAGANSLTHTRALCDQIFINVIPSIMLFSAHHYRLWCWVWLLFASGEWRCCCFYFESFK